VIALISPVHRPNNQPFTRKSRSRSRAAAESRPRRRVSRPGVNNRCRPMVSDSHLRRSHSPAPRRSRLTHNERKTGQWSCSSPPRPDSQFKSQSNITPIPMASVTIQPHEQSAATSLGVGPGRQGGGEVSETADGLGGRYELCVWRSQCRAASETTVGQGFEANRSTHQQRFGGLWARESGRRSS
jgi:hypothetical protein